MACRMLDCDGLHLKISYSGSLKIKVSPLKISYEEHNVRNAVTGRAGIKIYIYAFTAKKSEDFFFFFFFFSNEKDDAAKGVWPLVRPFPDAWKSRSRVVKEGAFPPRDIARRRTDACTYACEND